MIRNTTYSNKFLWLYIIEFLIYYSALMFWIWIPSNHLRVNNQGNGNLNILIFYGHNPLNKWCCFMLRGIWPPVTWQWFTRKNWWSVRFTWIDWDNLIELPHQVHSILSCLYMWTNVWTFKLVMYAHVSKWVSKTDFKKLI